MVQSEITTLGWTLACGAALGLIFDFWRACRAVLTPGWIVTSAGDLLFWLVAALAVAMTLLVTNYGQVRLYVFLSLGAGFSFYQLVFSPVLLPRLRLGVRTFYRGAGGLLRLLAWPLWFPVTLGVSLARLGGEKSRQLGRVLLRVFKRKVSLLRPKKKS